MNALVLAAGLGTRLLPLTDRKSKVALSLAGIPVIVRVVRMLRRHGVDRIVVNLHHAPATVKAALAEAGEEVAYSPEPEILGTGGALRGAREHLAGSSFLLVNGDCYHEDPDLEGAVEFHRRKGAMATMLLLDMPGGEAYRPVELDNQSRILRVAGKPQSSSMKEAASLHFPGIHIFEPEVLDLVRPGFSDVNGTLYPRLIESGLPVFGYHTDFRWFDLGTPARFLEAA
ncbi:MAG: sugar phosphate nucleotidyltransferase, partial [Candidatus Glassbacteria bacterium]